MHLVIDEIQGEDEEEDLPTACRHAIGNMKDCLDRAVSHVVGHFAASLPDSFRKVVEDEPEAKKSRFSAVLRRKKDQEDEEEADLPSVVELLDFFDSRLTLAQKCLPQRAFSRQLLPALWEEVTTHAVMTLATPIAVLGLAAASDSAETKPRGTFGGRVVRPSVGSAWGKSDAVDDESTVQGRARGPAQARRVADAHCAVGQLLHADGHGLSESSLTESLQRVERLAALHEMPMDVLQGLVVSERARGDAGVTEAEVRGVLVLARRAPARRPSRAVEGGDAAIAKGSPPAGDADALAKAERLTKQIGGRVVRAARAATKWADQEKRIVE